MAKEQIESFSSRFGLIAATLGMAIGAGNIWRFPRLAGQYGGSFLIPWLIFLFIWSIPLLAVEFTLGKKLRKGVVGSFSLAMGQKFTWMGWFVAFCTAAIMFYYSVVSGWALKYFLLSVGGQITKIDHAAYWNSYVASYYQPLFFHFFSLFLAAILIYLGIVKGVERFSKVIIPLLFILLIGLAAFAFTLPGAENGINYFFSFKIDVLKDYKIWLDALSQSAWSTGAGWGLILTYSVYSREKENIFGNVFLTGFGNNLASVFAGLVIIPTVFALSGSIDAAHQALASGNQGLAFIALPKLFSEIPAGRVISVIFFLALFFAALSSLISMVEMAVRVLIDFGTSRKKAIIYLALVSATLGIPSALFLNFFNNQDWVWGLGLMVSGFFFTMCVIKIGPIKFVKEWIQVDKYEIIVAKSFKILFYYILPFEFIAMLIWWFYQSIGWSEKALDPLETSNIGTTVLQWTVIILIGLVLNKKMVLWLKKNE